MPVSAPATISPRVSVAVLEVGRNHRAATPDDEAPQAVRIHGRGEERGGGADVRTDDVRVLEPERVGDENHELAHRPRRHQRVATLGMAEPGQVDRHQVRVFGEAEPRRLEGVQAFRPRAQQERVIVAVLALGGADGQPVDDPVLRLDGTVQPCVHA